MTPQHTVSQHHVQLSAACPVRAADFATAWPVAPHDHDYTEICLLAAGAGFHGTVHGRVPLAPRTAIVALPGQVHAFEPRGTLRGFNLYYLSEWFLTDWRPLREHLDLLALFFGPELFPATARHRPLVQVTLDRAAFQAAWREAQDIRLEGTRPRPSLLFLKSCLAKLLVTLASSVARSLTLPRLPIREDVWRALDRIEDLAHAGEPFRWPDVARGAPVSPDRLGRLFKQQTGCSPRTFVLRRRIRAAAGLLLDSSLSITEIAFRLGFTDTAHFSRLFKRHYALAPRQFRSRYTPPPSR